MANRRTRKDKEQAHHQFLYSWDDEPKNVSFKAGVKGQTEKRAEAKIGELSLSKMAVNQAQVYDLASVRKDIGRSLIIASLILGAELVIYLAWF